MPLRPDAPAVRAFVDWIESELDRDPRPFLRAPIPHRLNRREYGNAVRDLLGVDVDPTLLLPADNFTMYFDTIGEALTTTSELMAAYESAAENISFVAMDSARDAVFVCAPASAADRPCAIRIVTDLVSRAFRGSGTREDVDRIMAVHDANVAGANLYPSFDRGIRMILRSILTDSKFLYRIENVPSDAAAGQSYRISDVELASRLSYFLWSSGPDAQLLELAARGVLHEPAILERETRRMLRDPKAEALAVHFAGGWLGLSGGSLLPPVAGLPDFTDRFRQDARREVELLFKSVIDEDRTVLDLLTANYTFVNERLARHYGMPNVLGDEFRRVMLSDAFDVRRGLLGKAAILSNRSKGNRTSPTNRGQWILTALLGTPAPDPPPNVPPLPAVLNLPMRRVLDQQLAVRNDCVLCHSITDPLGLALDNFDSIGRWRTEEAGTRIDPVVQLADGTTISGPADVRAVILGRSDQFVRTLTLRLFTYAMGRRTGYQDMPLVRAIARDAAASGSRFSAIVVGIVQSAPFQMNVKP